MNCQDQPSAWWIVQPSGNMIYVSHQVVVETVQRMIGSQVGDDIHPIQVMAAWRSSNVKPLYEKQITAEKGAINETTRNEQNQPENPGLH